MDTKTIDKVNSAAIVSYTTNIGQAIFFDMPTNQTTNLVVNTEISFQTCHINL